MTQHDLLSRAVSDVVPRPLAEEKLKSGKKMRIYLGIDPTGFKLHLGHSVPLRKLKAFCDSGHDVVFLIGSFTAMIGDPTGRDQMREPLTREQVQKNFETYKEQAGKILDFSKIEIRYNHEWLETLKFDDIIKLASNFTVHQMLERDMYQERMKSGGHIGLHEFFYPLMVGYDSVMLDVDVELGGNDQLFNMLAGRTLQKAYGKRDKFVLTTKLLEGTDGRKMSKTYDNCIYLTDEPRDMFGKVMSVKDDLIATYFEYTTDVAMAEIKDMEKAMKKGENPMTFKKRLAMEIVTLYHGKKAAEDAEAAFVSTFSKQEIPDDIEEIESKPRPLQDILTEIKMVTSKTEVRRLVEQKAIHMIQFDSTSNISMTVEDVIAGTFPKGIDNVMVTLKIGKRKFLKIRYK